MECHLIRQLGNAAIAFFSFIAAMPSAIAATNFWPQLEFKAPKWSEGQPQWPFVEFEPALGDISRYDRMVVDYCQDGAGGPDLCFYLAKGGVRTPFYNRKVPDHDCDRWVFDLAAPKAARPDVTRNVTRIRFHAVRPGTPLNIWIDRVSFLEPGEPLPEDEGLGERIRAYATYVAAVRDSRQAAVARQHEKDFVGWRKACAAAGSVKGAFVLGQASPTENVRPRANLSAKPASDLKVRLARNETEAIQLLVAPASDDLRGVRVSVDMDGSGFASTNVSCHPVGYVRTRKTPPYVPAQRASARIPGWWPDPILTYTNAADVAGMDVQSFWIDVRCPEGQAAGAYRGKVVVSAEGVEPQTIPLEIRVNGFSLPSTAPMPIALTFCPNMRHTFLDGTALEKGNKPLDTLSNEAPVRTWARHREEWCDYLADHFITFGSLYWYPPVSSPQWDILERLRDQGRLGCFNLGYWVKPNSLSDEDKEKWRANCLAPLKARYEEAVRRGLVGNAYLYGCDEAKEKEFPAVNWAARELKAAMPEVPVSTTAFCYDFGTNSPLDGIDWFTPKTDVFAGNPDAVAEGRAAGHGIWWYFCCQGATPPPNAFVECPAIEMRLVMGALAAKYRPDGFLYYQISFWNVDHPITGGPWTDWNPRTWNGYHGDGGWTCVGPDGTPLTTIRMENFRDGLEDLWYVKLLEAKSGKPVEVPPEVAKSMQDYTYDSAVLAKWRDSIADELEHLGN